MFKTLTKWYFTLWVMKGTSVFVNTTISINKSIFCKSTLPSLKNKSFHMEFLPGTQMYHLRNFCGLHNHLRRKLIIFKPNTIDEEFVQEYIYNYFTRGKDNQVVPSNKINMELPRRKRRMSPLKTYARIQTTIVRIIILVVILKLSSKNCILSWIQTH